MRKSVECDDIYSFFLEFIEYIFPISFEKIDTKRPFSFVRKSSEDTVKISTEDRLESRCEKFWKQRRGFYRLFFYETFISEGVDKHTVIM
jgi:hypothetical protein